MHAARQISNRSARHASHCRDGPATAFVGDIWRFGLIRRCRLLGRLSSGHTVREGRKQEGKRWSGRPGWTRRYPAWEAGVLPLNYSRLRVLKAVESPKV